MSQRTLPLLFFNLGGEMLYILHQRLHAQNVLTGKTARGQPTLHPHTHTLDMSKVGCYKGCPSNHAQ